MVPIRFPGFGSKIPAHFYDAAVLRQVQDKLGYRFRKLELLCEALSHRSYTQTADKPPFQSFERLEFLGDSVLGMLISDALFNIYKDRSEGELTKTKANLVNMYTLSKICGEITLNSYIRLSEEEEKSGGRERESIMADCLEAVIGAIYTDGGIKPAQKFVHKHFLTRMEEILSDQSLRNFKGELLELVQANCTLSVKYEILKTEGPDHLKKFTVAACLADKQLGKGRGNSKKEAEQHAAEQAIKELKKLKENKTDFFNKLEGK